MRRLISVLFAGLVLVGGLLLIQTMETSAASHIDGLVGYWNFDEGTGAVVLDASGHGHEGQIHGATYITTDLPPVPGNLSALHFDGTAEVVIPDSPDLSFGPGQAFSIALWFKLEQARSVFHIYGKRAQCGAMNYQLARDGGLLHFNAPRVNTGVDVPLNQYVHAVVTYDGVATLRIFLDGVEVVANTSYALADNPPSDLEIASSGGCSEGENFPGIIDDVRIYNRALTADEVGELANADGAPEDPNPPEDPNAPVCTPAPAGMVAWWPANGNADDIIGGRNGSLINGAGFAAGKVGDAFAVDGSNYIEVNDDDVWTLGNNAFTIDLWVNFNGLSGRDPFIAHDEAGGPSSKWIFWYDAQGHRAPFGPALRLHVFVLDEGNYDPVVFPWTPEVGRWYHVAVTREGQVFKLYLDGNLVMTEESAVTIPNPETTLTIGKAEGFTLNGRLDEIEIFDRALSADEIRAIYDAGSAGKCLNSSPVASAGEDQTVACGSVSGTETTLDGSASSDPDGDTLTYTWTGPFPEGNGTVTGVNPTVTLPLGTHAITLVVNDGTADSAPDTVDITVKVTVVGLQPPLAGLAPEGEMVPLPARAFKAGSTLPLRLEMFCGATELTDADVAAPRILALARQGDAVDIPLTDPDSGEANDTGLLFRYSDGNWVYNLSTKTLGLTAGTYTITIELPDGLRYNAGFVLR